MDDTLRTKAQASIDAYADFVDEMEGGLSEQKKRIRADTDAMLQAMRGRVPS